MVIKSITLVLFEPSVPPAIRPLVALEEESLYFLATVKLPKFVEFPEVDMVINSIAFSTSLEYSEG